MSSSWLLSGYSYAVCESAFIMGLTLDRQSFDKKKVSWGRFGEREVLRGLVMPNHYIDYSTASSSSSSSSSSHQPTNHRDAYGKPLDVVVFLDGQTSQKELDMIMATCLVVLISGNGSNLQAIIDAIASGVLYDTMIALVISNRTYAYGLQRVREASIETAYHNLIPYNKKVSNSDT